MDPEELEKLTNEVIEKTGGEKSLILDSMIELKTANEIVVSEREKLEKELEKKNERIEALEKSNQFLYNKSSAQLLEERKKIEETPVNENPAKNLSWDKIFTDNGDFV